MELVLAFHCSVQSKAGECVWVCVMDGKLVRKYVDVSIYFFYSLCVNAF